jgi:hypothetical protein
MYYGDEVPELQYSVNGSELLGIPTISCSATSSSPVGTYDIILGIGTITNHTVELVNSTLTILPAPLVISVQDEERYYGENNPDFIVQYDGFKNYEDESIMQIIPQAVTTATQYSDCGMYPITITEAYAPNYDITYINGNLTINQASQQIKWEQEFDNVKVGDLIEIVFSTTTDLPITITSDNESVARITKLINDRTFVSIDDFGTSTITISQLGDQNYLPVEVSKLLTVSNASGMVDVEQSEPFELVGNVIHLNTYVRTRVYNLSGIMVYDGYDATIALQSGYYVIFIGIDKYKIKI